MEVEDIRKQARHQERLENHEVRQEFEIGVDLGIGSAEDRSHIVADWGMEVAGRGIVLVRAAEVVEAGARHLAVQTMKLLSAIVQVETIH